LVNLDGEMQNLPKLDFKKQVCKYLSPGAQYYAIRIYDTIEGHQHNFNNAPKSIQLILDNSHPEYYRVLAKLTEDSKFNCCEPGFQSRLEYERRLLGELSHEFKIKRAELNSKRFASDSNPHEFKKNTFRDICKDYQENITQWPERKFYMKKIEPVEIIQKRYESVQGGEKKRSHGRNIFFKMFNK